MEIEGAKRVESLKIVLSLPALEKTILSLPAPLVIAFPLGDEPVEEAETSRATFGVFETATIGLRIEAFALRDHKLAHEFFSEMLLLTNTNELLDVP